MPSCLRLPLLLALVSHLLVGVASGADRPNIVLIYADDLGFGDVSCNGSKTIDTPNIDRIANEGIRFTDAHCSAATCTPSRYALLTGSYAFRQDNTGIRPGDANLIIEPGSATLPERLRSVGYDTAVVGKWHLGLGRGPIDWNGHVAPGPKEVGFNYHFLIPATGDRTPCVYLEQGSVVDHDPADPIAVSYGKRIGTAPTGAERPDLLKMQLTHGHDQTIVNGISRIGYMTGGHRARWIDEQMADVITTKAVRYLEERTDQPFFLFFSTQDIHVPRAPHSRFVGKSGMGPRGDAILQLDWCVGELLSTLDEQGIADKTLVIFTSDNGPVLDDGYADRANEQLGKHRPGGPFRAGKYSLFEGGTRVPFVARWPGKITPGSQSAALLGQIDLAATLAKLVGAETPAGALPDSRDALATLTGSDKTGRDQLVHEAYELGLRQGPWKYLRPTKTRDGLGPWVDIKTTGPGRLYNVADDPGETRDLAAAQPERAATMREKLNAIVAGRDR